MNFFLSLGAAAHRTKAKCSCRSTLPYMEKPNLAVLYGFITDFVRKGAGSITPTRVQSILIILYIIGYFNRGQSCTKQQRKRPKQEKPLRSVFTLLEGRFGWIPFHPIQRGTSILVKSWLSWLTLGC